MAKCPKCFREIDALYLESIVRADVSKSYNVYLTPDQDLDLYHVGERDGIEE